MDPKNDRVDHNDPLRLLFQEMGRTHAPVDLESRILEQLTASTVVSSICTPLISIKLWYSIAAMLAIVLVVAATFSSVASTTISSTSSLIHRLHIPQLSDLLMSPWVMAAVGSVFVLTLMDRSITGRLRTTHAR